MHVRLAAFAAPNGLLSALPWPIMSEGTGDEENVTGYCLTFTCFRVTFQVFIPFVTGDLAPLEDFHGSVVQIWPPALASHLQQQETRRHGSVTRAGDPSTVGFRGLIWA